MDTRSVLRDVLMPLARSRLLDWCRILRYVLATPQFHHWHHAKHPDFVDSNYAVHLPVVDMLFGTFKCPRGRWPEAYGVVSGGPPETFWSQQLHPFRG